jgi:starch phosphorylase
MKFMMNGAVTIGTLDGANVEMREEVGAENFYVFGLKADEVERVKRESRSPQHYVDRNDELRNALDLIASGRFSRGDRDLFKPLVDKLRQSDPFLVLADYEDYVACQQRVGDAWHDDTRWARTSILNTARSSKFSSDRAIQEYCVRIWRAAPVPIVLDRVPTGSSPGGRLQTAL